MNVKSFIKIVFYIFIIFSFLFLTSNKVIGPFCMRHICAVGLFIYYLFSSKKIKFDYIEKLYFLYLTTYIICNVLNGEIMTSSFLTRFVSYHFSDIVLICSIPIIINKKEDFNLFIVALLLIYVSNSLLTIAQFFSIPFSWEIGQMVNDGLSRELDANEAIFNDDMGLIGRTITAGFTGFVVTNGYFTTCYLPIAHQAIKIKNNVFLLLFLIIIALTASFVNQERSAFFLVLAYFLIYLFLYKGISKVFFLFFCIVLIILFLNVDFSQFELGRFAEFSDRSRNTLWKDFYDFLGTDRALFGGENNYVSLYKVNQHNCLTAAWTIGGIFTFLTFSILYFSAALVLTRLIVNRVFIESNAIAFSLAFSCMLYLIYSLTHSSGLHNDGVMFWLPYTLLLKYKKIFKKNYNENHFDF